MRRGRRATHWLFAAGLAAACLCPSSRKSAAEEPPAWPQVAELLKTRCVKCHGPAKAEGGLRLMTPGAAAKGGDSGTAIAPHDLEASLLWRKVSEEEMPPDAALPGVEKELIRNWILAGAPGLPAPMSAGDAADHWAFRPLSRPALPSVGEAAAAGSAIDLFLESDLQARGLKPNGPAPPETRLRRAALVATGLPSGAEPSLAMGRSSNLSENVADGNEARGDVLKAYQAHVDRLLASPHFGERWGKFWLDASGYADSNGYFNADSARPWAWKYRDYVISSYNADKPLSDFLREQLAGDVLARRLEPEWRDGAPASRRLIELLTATHFLRNGQDGTSESDGNPDELRVDRYAALESCVQNFGNAVLGLTVQCAKCHDHKFEPITQRDYYALQSIFYPVFPARHEAAWIKPNDRLVFAPLAEEQAAWERRKDELEARHRRMTDELAAWLAANRPSGELLFSDGFETPGGLAQSWSNRAPGDDGVAGVAAVSLGEGQAPLAKVENGALVLREGGPAGDKWLCTTASFDWTPEAIGESIQVSFDLVSLRVDSGGDAERVGYVISAHDFDDSGPVGGGNILIDGHPSGPSAVYLDYPGEDSQQNARIGSRGYQAGGNYGVRITKIGDDEFRLSHVVGGVVEKSDGDELRLPATALPDGAFAWELCCGRSFVVDNLRVERFEAGDKALAAADRGLSERQKSLAAVAEELESLRRNRPGAIAWAAAVSEEPLAAPLLTRGDYSQPGETIAAEPLAVLTGADHKPQPSFADNGAARLALADWLTMRGSPAEGLTARVQANRIWQACFGRGLAATTDNLGLAGETPTHPQLLEWLACELVESGWSVKHLVREILLSDAFQRSSGGGFERPSEADVWLARFPARRLEAEAIRDSLLAVSGELDERLFGPPTATQRIETGEVLAAESTPGARRRSVYLRQRRTEVVSMLQVFDAPSIVFNSIRRPSSAMPLQALTLLNSEFVLSQAAAVCEIVVQQSPSDRERIAFLFQQVLSRTASPEETEASLLFLQAQTKLYGGDAAASEKAWKDLCHSLLASNEFLYLD